MKPLRAGVLLYSKGEKGPKNTVEKTVKQSNVLNQSKKRPLPPWPGGKHPFHSSPIRNRVSIKGGVSGGKGRSGLAWNFHLWPETGKKGGSDSERRRRQDDQKQ